jgi:hypothetical protein
MNQRLGMIVALLLAPFWPRLAEADVSRNTEKNLPIFEVELRNYLLVQNDGDFDRTAPLYDEYGQSVGYLATTIKPGCTWRPLPDIVVRFQAHIGENIWSRHDPEAHADQAGANDQTFQAKEIWADLALPADMAIRAGYQYLFDPTHLFLNRHIGAVQWYYTNADKRLGLIIGQIPDSVYEGIAEATPAEALTHNNFQQDIWLAGLQGEITARSWKIAPALYGLTDRTEIDRPQNLLNVSFHAEGPLFRRLLLDLDVALQSGVYKHGALNGQDVTLLGYAAQLGASLDQRPLRLKFNALLFSGDNADRNDTSAGAFRYSGWSKSSTLFLSENELFDQYNNLDELVARQQAGLFMVDIKGSYSPLPPLELFGIVGYGGVIDRPGQSQDRTVATELDLGIGWNPHASLLELKIVGTALWPGQAGAMLRNEIDMSSKDLIYAGQMLMAVTF